MSRAVDIDPNSFVSAVKPLLQNNDLPGLLSLLKSRWNPDQIVSFFSSNHCDARKVAALALSLVGGKCCIDPLVLQLRDPDRMVNEMAEHALWSIWFRCGTPEANHQLARGSQAMDRRDFDHALEHFSRAVEMDPGFAEAYNQRALTYYLQEKFAESIADCKKSVELMPCHFGAWASLGHCYAHLARFCDAQAAYEKALLINPHLDCIREAVAELCRAGKPA